MGIRDTARARDEIERRLRWEKERRKVVDYICRGCSAKTIGDNIAANPDLAEQDDWLDEYYILPIHPRNTRRFA